MIRDIHRKSVLPVRLLDVAERMEKEGFPEDTSNDGIHFDRPRGAEWLNDVFQEHINTLESDLLETAQFTSRALSGRLGTRVDARDGSRSIQTRLQSATPMETEEVMSSTPPGSAMSSVVVAESKREKRSMETARLRYPEKVKELDLESLECRRELAETLGIERVSHEDLNRHHCVDWLKAHEAHFSRTKLMETTDLTGIPTKAIMGPINYRPLKLLGSPGLITEPPKHRTSIARIRLATPAQLKVVDKLLNPGSMELPDAAYEGSKLAEDPRYGKPCGSTQLAKTLAVYDRADPAAARVVIVAGSDFEGTSPKLFWPENLIYSLPGAELNQMLTLVVAIKSEMPCEPELLLFAGMNDHLHAVGLLEQLKGDENPPSRKIWEAIQVLFAAMNEVQENVVSRFGSKTKVVFTTSPGYANMPRALQFVYAVLILIAEGNEWRILMAAPNRELEPSNLRLRKSELAAAWADISHALRGFYGLVDILIVLDEVLLLEISNFARQLKFSPVIRDDHPAISQLTARLCFRSMDVMITNSTSKSRGPSNERRNVAETEKQLESMKYRLTQENGWWPFLTPRLENATNKTREEAPPLVKQVWSFLEKQLELAETRDMTVARFVSAANEVTIGGFWREHAKGELRTRRDYEVLKFLSPCWEKEFMAGMFGTTATIFGAFVQEILGMPISLLLALYLVYPRYLFNMGPAYMFSRGVETLRVDGYLALLLLTHGELVSFHRLMEYGEPLSMGRVHSSIETSSYKCAAGLKTLLVQYLMMQNRHMTGEDENPTSREEWKKTNRGMPLLTDLCLAMRSGPMGIIRGLEEVVTCIYGPAVTYAFPDPLVTTYRHSVTHLSLISILDGTALNWCQQEVLRGRMSNTVLFGKVKDAELIVYNFRGQMQCRMGGKREGPIEMYPKFWNLNPLTADGREILVDKAFSVPKCVRLARISHHSHKLLRKIRGTVPKELRDDLSEIWGEELLKLERENTSDHERQNVIGKPVGSAPNLEDNDMMHERMMELEPLLEASGERNLRSIEITHGECPCHCLAQTVWYPDHKNLCLVWDMEEIRSIGLPDHRQKVTILVVSTMLALRWIEENITKYREAGTPTAESIYAIDYSRRLELFETACKVFAIPTEVRHVWSRLRYFPWFRATLTSWLYMTTKDHMRKHQKEYRQFQAEIGPEAFKRPLLTHRNAITTGWKRVGKMSRDNTKARESILEEDLAKNVSLSLHNSFCLNRESRVKALPNQAKRLQEQREWMRSYEQLKAWEEIVISSDDEE